MLLWSLCQATAGFLCIYATPQACPSQKIDSTRRPKLSCINIIVSSIFFSSPLNEPGAGQSESLFNTTSFPNTSELLTSLRVYGSDFGHFFHQQFFSALQSFSKSEQIISEITKEGLGHGDSHGKYSSCRCLLHHCIFRNWVSQRRELGEKRCSWSFVAPFSDSKESH